MSSLKLDKNMLPQENSFSEMVSGEIEVNCPTQATFQNILTSLNFGNIIKPNPFHINFHSKRRRSLIKFPLLKCCSEPAPLIYPDSEVEDTVDLQSIDTGYNENSSPKPTGILKRSNRSRFSSKSRSESENMDTKREIKVVKIRVAKKSKSILSCFKRKKSRASK